MSEKKENRSKSFIIGNCKRDPIALDMELKDDLDKSLDIYIEAEQIMSFIKDGVYTVGALPAEYKKILFKYLSVFSPVISRVIELHTKLPLSTLRLQKPSHSNDIVQDYVYDWFNRLINSTDFKTQLKKIVQDYWTFGEGLGLVEDDHCYHKDLLINNDDLQDITLPEISQDILDSLEPINTAYRTDPDSVSWSEKSKVIKTHLLQTSKKSYKGLLNFKYIDSLDVRDQLINTDVGYYIYNLPASKNLQNYFAANNSQKSDKVIKSLKDMGYSQAFIEKHLDCEYSEIIDIDNNPYNDEGLYMIRLADSNEACLDDSILNRVLESAILNLMAARANNTLVKMSSKIDRFVTAKDASDAQLSKLQDDLEEAIQAESGVTLAVNFEVKIEELGLETKDKLNLDDVIKRTQSDIMGTIGMPEELISGEASYGSSFLKVELLSNEYVEFRNRLKDFLENQIFKPLAIKKGFITVDAWGNTVPIIPSVRFDKFSISRQSEDIAMIKDLVKDNHLPVSDLLVTLGYNPDDVEQRLNLEQNTILNSAVKDLLDDAMSDMSRDLAKNEAFIEMVNDIIGLKKEENNNGESE